MIHSEAFSIFGQVLLCLVLTFIPGFAACSFAVRRGASSRLWLSLIALAQIGLMGYLAFWLWFASPSLGRVFSFCLPVVSAIYLAATLRSLDSSRRKILLTLFTPIALTGIAALIVLSAGFLYGGFEEPLQTALSRFSHPLPGDNWIPYHFAVALEKHVYRPRFGDWLSSDRPPLQTGIYLSEFGYIRGQKGYQVLSVILQSLWIYALYVLLLSLQVKVKAVRPALVACLLSGFVLVNTFFVWPKLLAAAYLLAFSSIVFSPKFWEDRINSSKAMLTGALLALGLLTHGGIIFSALGIILVLFVLRFRARWTRTGWFIVLSCVCLYLPWLMYQKFYDPPGDWLLKWHLAGMIAKNPLTFGQAISQAYGHLSAAQIINYKLSNFETVYNNPLGYWTQVASFLSQVLHSPQGATALQLAHDLRGTQFFYFVPSLGFLMFGPFALFAAFWRKRGSHEWKAGVLLYGCAFFTVFFWCLIMFGPGTTVVHQGSYAANLMAMAAAVVAFYSLSPFLSWLLASAQVAITFLLYGAYMGIVGSLRLGMLGLLVFALLMMGVLISRLRQPILTDCLI